MRYLFTPEPASGGRKSFERIVTGTDRSKVGVAALHGYYLQAGRQVDLPERTVLVEVCHTGPANRPDMVARVCIVRDDDFRTSRWFGWRSQFLDLLDRVDAALKGTWPKLVEPQPAPCGDHSAPGVLQGPAEASSV
jgi:hypothetical protein